MDEPTEPADFPRSYTQKQLYELVADASSYPRFLPFCTGARVLSRQPPSPPNDPHGRLRMDVELTVGFMSFTETYVSKVTCRPYESVEVSRHIQKMPRIKADVVRPNPGCRGDFHALVQIIKHGVAISTRLRAIAPPIVWAIRTRCA